MFTYTLLQVAAIVVATWIAEPPAMPPELDPPRCEWEADYGLICGPGQTIQIDEDEADEL